MTNTTARTSVAAGRNRRSSLELEYADGIPERVPRFVVSVMAPPHRGTVVRLLGSLTHGVELSATEHSGTWSFPTDRVAISFNLKAMLASSPLQEPTDIPPATVWFIVEPLTNAAADSNDLIAHAPDICQRLEQKLLAEYRAFAGNAAKLNSRGVSEDAGSLDPDRHQAPIAVRMLDLAGESSLFRGADLREARFGVSCADGGELALVKLGQILRSFSTSLGEMGVPLAYIQHPFEWSNSRSNECTHWIRLGYAVVRRMDGAESELAAMEAAFRVGASVYFYDADIDSPSFDSKFRPGFPYSEGSASSADTANARATSCRMPEVDASWATLQLEGRGRSGLVGRLADSALRPMPFVVEPSGTRSVKIRLAEHQEPFQVSFPSGDLTRSQLRASLLEGADLPASSGFKALLRRSRPRSTADKVVGMLRDLDQVVNVRLPNIEARVASEELVRALQVQAGDAPLGGCTMAVLYGRTFVSLTLPRDYQARAVARLLPTLPDLECNLRIGNSTAIARQGQDRLVDPVSLWIAWRSPDKPGIAHTVIRATSQWLQTQSRISDGSEPGFGIQYAVSRTLDESSEPGTGSCAGKLLLKLDDSTIERRPGGKERWSELAAFIVGELERRHEVELSRAEEFFNGPLVVVRTDEPNERPWARLAAWDFVASDSIPD